MFKTIYQYQVDEYVNAGADVWMLDKKDGKVWEVAKQTYAYIIEALKDMTDRYYFWIVNEEDENE